MRDELLETLDRIRSTVYWNPGAPDSFFNLGMLFHEMAETDRAIDCYQHSPATAGPAAETLYDIGLCEHLAGHTAAALDWLRQALELDPKHILARGLGGSDRPG
jgi:tetratricopeptide (TPR) repeat protein